MSATIGAALKKIAVALLSDPKVLKTVCGIILGIIIIVVMPIVAVASVFSGSIDIDTDKLGKSIQENISAEQMENLQLINDTMTEVEKQLDKKKLSDYNTQAEVIYLFSLSDKSKERDFVKNFVSCFKKNQSDEDLIKSVNRKFGTEIEYDEFQKMMQSIKGAEISTAGFTDSGANSIWNSVTESGSISTMPDTPGLAVWMDGHIGVYVGNGVVIEAQGTAYGVVKTKLSDRGWTKWMKIPNITYVE